MAQAFPPAGTPFATWLRQHRKALDLTQEQLAAAIDVSLPTIVKIEAGQRRPSRQVAELLARCLEVPPEEQAAFMRLARTPLPAAEAPGQPPSEPTAALPPLAILADVLPVAHLGERASGVDPDSGLGEAAAFTNLPIPLTSFVGRERELAEVSRLLAEGGSLAGGRRLLTLTGAGGSGKTRLAIQAARQMLPQWRHGVWWADLSVLQDPAILPETVLTALGMAPSPGRPPLEAVIRFLHERRLLLVLDNCEHLTEACAHLVAAVLGACPEVQVLATSREPLGVPGEQLWPVPTFSVPAAAEDLDAEYLLGYDAIRLFVDRATMHRPAFELRSDNAAQVTEICRRLDGIPLAIELAAARVRTMSLDDILTRLQKRLRLLASGSTLAPPRHQTLRASIDWTYGQLMPAECLLLQRLAVFAGGCTLAAAEAICAGGGLAGEEVLDVLGWLVDRSLVVAEGGRYRMLETIREYALERLADAGGMEAVRDRHSEHYLALVREQDGRLCSGDQKAALAEMETEIANIRLALEWAIGRRQIAQLREISFPLLYFYTLRGWDREGEAIFHEAAARLQSLEETDPGLERSRQIVLLDMKTNQAYFCGFTCTPAEAYAMQRECRERLRSLGDKTVLRYSLRYGGNNAEALGRFDEAESCLLESLALSQASGRLWDIGIVSAYLGYTTRDTGAPERAQGYFHQALEIGRKLGDPRLLAYSLNGLGTLLLMLGQPVQARELAEQALALAQSTGDRYDLASSWSLLGQVALRLGEPAKAGALLAKGIVLGKELGWYSGLTSMTSLLGYVALSAGDLREAESRFCAALSMATRHELVVWSLDALAGLASVFARKGETESSLALVAFVLHHPASIASARNRAERLRPELEAQLTPERVQAIELRARAETFEEIVQKLLAGSTIP